MLYTALWFGPSTPAFWKNGFVRIDVDLGAAKQDLTFPHRQYVDQDLDCLIPIYTIDLKGKAISEVYDRLKPWSNFDLEFLEGLIPQ